VKENNGYLRIFHLLKMNVSKLINYSMDMCWNGQGAMLFEYLKTRQFQGFWVCLLPRQGYIVFRFIIEYSSLRDFYRPLGNNNNRSIF
jgi:hypothetical protein